MKRLANDEGLVARAAVRSTSLRLPGQAECVAVGELHSETPWDRALVDVDTVVHLAARVHVMRESTSDPLAQFRRVNVEGTLSLARAAVRAGARRLIFVSSVGVHGNVTVAYPYSEDDPFRPYDAYSASKVEAEQGLRRLGAETGLDVVIVRPPLVYGPNAPGNFGRLLRMVRRQIPLPFGAVYNRRSLIAVDNLADFLHLCVQHPAAANETFLVCDGEDLSTTDLIRRLARALNHPSMLLPVPPSVLSVVAQLLGRRDLALRLLGSLQVDMSKARRLLGWTPPVSVDEGLRLTGLPFK